jgi:hypothetical protein
MAEFYRYVRAAHFDRFQRPDGLAHVAPDMRVHAKAEQALCLRLIPCVHGKALELESRRTPAAGRADCLIGEASAWAMVYEALALTAVRAGLELHRSDLGGPRGPVECNGVGPSITISDPGTFSISQPHS